MQKNLLTELPKGTLAPSVLAADFLRLEDEISWINQTTSGLIHLDVMDGSFVPNISFGLPVIKAINTLADRPLDVHLMINRPDLLLPTFYESGADIISVHYEACTHLHKTVADIHKLGALAGVAINPHTSVDLLDDVLEELDMVVVMSVNPGWGGQKFIYRSLEKINQLKEKITVRNLQCKIEVDGGVGLQNAESILSAGADILVAGSSVFRSENRDDTVRRFHELSTASV